MIKGFALLVKDATTGKKEKSNKFFSEKISIFFLVTREKRETVSEHESPMHSLFFRVLFLKEPQDIEGLRTRKYYCKGFPEVMSGSRSSHMLQVCR